MLGLFSGRGMSCAKCRGNSGILMPQGWQLCLGNVGITATKRSKIALLASATSYHLRDVAANESELT